MAINAGSRVEAGGVALVVHELHSDHTYGVRSYHTIEANSRVVLSLDCNCLQPMAQK